MKYLPTGCIALVLATGCIGYRKVGEPANAGAGPPANSAVLRSGLQPPPALEIEHKHLHHQLEAALAAGGDTGAAAKEVAAVLLPHFQAEEAFALPPLGLLESLARKETMNPSDAQRAIAMAERLRREYETMLAEHKSLVEALRKLKAAASEEGKPEQAAFAEALILHAQTEEQVLYPATLLIGEYLKLQRVSGRN